MKKLLYIIGGQATGKMTVGEELSKITGLKLFHNHMTVEIANYFYGFGEELDHEKKAKHKVLFANMRERLREVIFENLAKSYLDGVIFTSVMYFDAEEYWRILLTYHSIFVNAAKLSGEEIEFYVVELDCNIDERHKRNVTENRLQKKPSKRNIEWTKNDINKAMINHRITSNSDDIKRFNTKQYLKIDNTKLSAGEVARIIKETFEL